MGTNSTITLTGPTDELKMLIRSLAARAKRKDGRRLSQVMWDFEDVTPPPGQYIPPDAFLVIACINPNAAISALNVAAKTLSPDGEIVTHNWNPIPPQQSGYSRFPFKLDEGFLLSLTIQAVPFGVVRSGDVYVQAFLQQTAATGTPVPMLLSSGYLTSVTMLSWPNGRMTQACEGHGTLQGPAIGNPAAGADFSWNPLLGVRAQVLAFSATLTTAVAAGNRIPTFKITMPSANLCWQVAPLTAQVASKTVVYNLTAGLQLATDAAGNQLLPLPSPLWGDSRLIIASST